MTTENDVVTTPAQEENKPEETVTPEQEETVGAVLQEKPHDAIPKVRLDKEIAKRKEAERALADLQKKATESDMSKTEIAQDLKSLADEHNIDPSFLNKLAQSIKAQAEADIEDKLRPFTEKERAAKIDAAFQTGFTKAMDNLPDYAEVVNPAVIKTLSLDPSNANKTFRQLIEETYGNAIGGKRTIEKAVPRGGNASGELDYQRAKRDPAYFKEVMGDAALKKQYNERMIGES